MSLALTIQNKRLLKRLLKTGRWGNESEIVRYGIHLVEREVISQARERWPQPLSDKTLDQIYRHESAEERAIERRLGQASPAIDPKDEPVGHLHVGVSRRFHTRQ